MSRRFNSLRYRLTFLLILGLIPCVGLTLYGNIEQRRLSLIRAQETALQSATDFAEVIGFMIDETRQMLEALAQEREIQNLDEKACSDFFNEKLLKHAFPMYSNLGLVNLKGKLVCSAFSGLETARFSDQPYFKEVLETKGFSVGLLVTCAQQGKGALSMGYSVLDDSGSLRGVVFAYLELGWLNHLASHAGLPTHATLTAIDKTGNVVARSADAEKWVGRSAPDSEIIKKVLADGKGQTEATGIDGVEKIYGFKQVGDSSKDLYVYVGITRSGVIASANRLLFFDLVWLAIAILIAISAVWVFTYYLITRQMNTLVTATNKIAGGNLTVRTGMDRNQGEIGFLGSAFDQMAEALHDRELERQRSHEALQKEKQFSEMVIDSLPGIFYLFDATGKMIRWNHNTETITGYSAGEISKSSPLDFVFEQERDLLTERIKDALETGEASMEAHYVTKSGASIPYYFTGKMAGIDQNKCVIGVGIDISARKKVEKALEDSERLLKTILAASPVGIHVADKREIKWANDAWIRMFGYKEEKDYVGQSASILYQSDEEFQRVGEALYPGLESTNVTETEAKMKRQDGTFFDAIIRIARLHSVDPEKESIVAVVSDISERKRQKRELSESEERYRNLVETMNEGLGMFDETGMVTYVNKRACEMLGYSGAEIIKRGIAAFVSGSSKQVLFEQTAQRANVPSRSYELEWITKDNQEICTLVSARTIWDADGKFKGSVATVTDITERKKYERQLQDSEKKMRLLIEQAPIGIGIFQNAKYVYANPELVTIFNCQHQDEIVGRPLTEFVAPGHQRLFIERYKRFLAGKPTRPSYQMEGFKKTGELFDVVLWPKKIKYDDKSAILAFMMDVTENKNLRAQLMQAQKMEAIGTLAGGIAHDFNNLLQVVVGYSELILMDSSLSDKLRQSVKSINKVALNGADLVRRLLTFSRKTETAPKPLNLNDEIIHIKKLLDRTIPKMIEIEIGLQNGLNTINADSSQIEQIMMNLAVNARDAMPDGGRLVIETEDIVLDQAYCSGHIEATPGPYVLVSVSDTGMGMDKKTMERIFEPFYTTKAPGKGTGLGLAMVYGIVKQHGGYIICYSEPAMGTTFKIYFPALVSDVVSEKLTGSLEAQGGTETILLVDDDENVRNVGTDLLQGAGYSVITAVNAKEALELFKNKHSSIALVILDLIMPEMSGKECLEELLKIDSNVKVLMCSGYSPNGAAKAAIDTGAKGFISKPYNSNEMLAQIRTILGPTKPQAYDNPEN